MARLNHPNIVQVYDFGQTDEFFYFVMEYVDGVNLRALMKDGTLKPEEALRIVPQVCEALQFAHERVQPGSHPCPGSARTFGLGKKWSSA